MPALIDFQDAVTASHLDPTQRHAVYYVDGAFANRDAVAAQCPHAKLYGITVFGATGLGIFACDSENGDLDIPSTLRWVAEQIALGAKLLCVYANFDRWVNLGLLAAIEALEKRFGVKVRKWVADYDNVRSNMEPWADADQYATGSVDRNVALANFFGDTPPAVTVDPHYAWFDARRRSVFNKLRQERAQVQLYDRLRALQTPKVHPRRVQIGFVRAVLGWYAGRLQRLIQFHPQHPDINRRQWRHDQLAGRAEGKRYV